MEIIRQTSFAFFFFFLLLLLLLFSKWKKWRDNAMKL